MFVALTLTITSGFLLWDVSFRRWRERKMPFREWHRADTILLCLFLGYAAIAGLAWEQWWRLG